jgi:predicted dienelactone hydrolase
VTPPADPSVLVPSTEAGPWVVHRRALDGGHELYLPSTTTAGPDRSLFPLPLVVFIPGFSAGPGDYDETLQRLASHGFLVVGARHGFDFVSATFCATQRSGFLRARAALDEVRRLARLPRARSDLHGVVDERAPVGAVGHSFGGKVALWLASEGNGVGAVVALDPVDGGDDRRPAWCGAADDDFPRIAARLDDDDLPPALLVVAGLSGACAPADGNGDVLFAALRSDAVLLRLPRATHTDFVDAADDENCGVCGLCPRGDEDGGDVLRLTRSAAVSFLRHRLLGDEREADWNTRGDVVDGSVDVETLRKP